MPPLPRQDRRTKTRNVPGHPQSQFPDASLDFQTRTEYYPSQNLTKPLPAFGTAHPTIGGLFLVDQNSEPGDNDRANLTQIYETLPGVWKNTTQIAEDGAVINVARRKNLIANITSEENVTTGVWQKVTQENANALIADEVSETRPVPGNAMISTRLADDSEVINIQRTLKEASTITDGEYNSGGFNYKFTREAVSDLVAWEILESRPIPGNITTDYDQDVRTGALVTTNYQIVDATTITDEGTIVVGHVLRYKHIDAFMSLRIESIYSTPPDRTEYRLGAYSFPNLLNGFSYTDACGAFVYQRSRFSAIVLMKSLITYSTAVVVPTAILIIPNSFQAGRFQVSEVLNDAGTLVFTGVCTLTATLPASTPSLSGYAAIAGTFQNIGGDSVQIAGGLFETMQVQVKML